MRRSGTFIASLLLLAACGRDEPAPKKESGYAYQPPAARPVDVAPGTTFAEVDCIDFRHVNGAFGRKYLPETMGAGVGMLDFDGDGDLDLLFVQSKEWPEHETGPQPTMRLYRNDGAWKFTDVTAGSGLEVPCYGMGCAIADYDADGDPDLYVTCLGPNLLFRNLGGGRFERVAGAPEGGSWVDKSGARHPSWSTGAAWHDADGDGDLDLIVVSYVQWTPETDVFASLTGGEKSYTRPNLYPGDVPRLYLQQADGSFVDATEESGLARVRDPGKSLGLCLDDFDGDGRFDLFVANDTVQNFLYLAKGPGRYEERAVQSAVAYDSDGRARAAMGIDSNDWRNDGKVAVAIGNFSEEPVSLFRVRRSSPGEVVFEDDANAARIGQPTLLPLTFGLALFDADLDGWCDLLLANGHIEPSVTKVKKEILYEQAPQLFRNLAGQSFVDVSADAGPPFRRHIVGRGLACGDLDGDLDLDCVFTGNAGKPLLMRNDVPAGAGALRLRLRQPGRNRDALGSVIRVTAGSVTQRRAVRTGGSYLSQGDPAATIGLGSAAKADRVVVRWPDGAEQEFGPLAPGSHILERKP